MKQLEKLGFVPGGDEAHEHTINPSDLKAKAFFDTADELLDELSVAVLDEVVPGLERYSGRWHPLGFMIFPLGVHPSNGSLRLHIWPEDDRREIPGGSGIHNHAWYIASRVLAGVYSDDRYKIEEETQIGNNEALPTGFLRVFRAHKAPNQPDGLATDGTIVKLTKTSHLEAQATQTHTITPDIFHIPTIAAGQLATTLVLDSPSFGYRPSILIDGIRGPESFHNPRPGISIDEALSAKQQILTA